LSLTWQRQRLDFPKQITTHHQIRLSSCKSTPDPRDLTKWPLAASLTSWNRSPLPIFVFCKNLCPNHTVGPARPYDHADQD
jgi:hypothetical protein